MNPKLSREAASLIESICTRGCGEVNQLLEEIRNGNTPEMLNGFSESESSMIVEELEAIMSVYKRDSS
jgi:hypothetical protein